MSRDPARRDVRPRRFDRNLVVIGAGSAGLVSAFVAATAKAKVTLVEADRMGGDCLSTGCVPSKALIRSARFVAGLGRAARFGIAPIDARVDFAAVMERVQRIVDTVAPHDSVERFTSLGVDVRLGRARILSPWEVEITSEDGRVERLTTRGIVVATGSRPRVPSLPGLDAAPMFTTENIWRLREQPERLIVLGGGPVGCELAQAFARLGSKVTQVQRGPRLLMREDDDVSTLVVERFRAEGIDVRLGHSAVRIAPAGDAWELIATDASGECRIAFDAILVAAGRQGNLSEYGLDAVGVAVAADALHTDTFLRTSVAGIYGAGDIVGPYRFTHTAARQGQYAAMNALAAPFWKFDASDAAVSWTTFVDPEVARVGLNEREAVEQGIAHDVTHFRFDELDRAITDDETAGFIKILTMPGRDRILGVTIVGARAGDLIAEYALAMKHRLGLNRIVDTTHVYPTFVEANRLAAAQWKLAHLSPRWLRWAQGIHRWRRG